MTTESRYITPGAKRRIEALAWALGCLIGLFILLGAYVAHVAIADCHNVGRVDTVIQQQGERGLRTLGKPGGVGFAYYQAHPRELVVARAQLVEQIREFQPPVCSIF